MKTAVCLIADSVIIPKFQEVEPAESLLERLIHSKQMG